MCAASAFDAILLNYGAPGIVTLRAFLNVSRMDSPLPGFESVKVRALLAYLAAEYDRPHNRESLATLLWLTGRSNRHEQLRYALADLRKVIGDRDASPHTCLSLRESLQLIGRPI